MGEEFAGENVSFLWKDAGAASGYKAAACLHGHTMHSEECLDFLPRYLHYVPGVSQLVGHYQRPYGGAGVDFARAYWTPPLTPASALELERNQIESMGLDAMVSLTDHDKIDACMSLLVTGDRSRTPVSVEWTVPFERSILHFGVHNLPEDHEREWMAEMAAYTAAPCDDTLAGMLQRFAAHPGVLVVLNHPYWLEEGIREADHARALERVFAESIDWIHALELNGTRSWKENSRVIELAAACERPVTSGGDRHACEPAACINLTNACSFTEFVAEIRSGQSTVLFLPQYREPIGLRVLEAARDILRPYPAYPGREHWTDRMFYRCADGQARPLSTIWRDRVPWILKGAAAIVHFVATTRLRMALRVLITQRGEILP